MNNIPKQQCVQHMRRSCWTSSNLQLDEAMNINWINVTKPPTCASIHMFVNFSPSWISNELNTVSNRATEMNILPKCYILHALQYWSAIVIQKCQQFKSNLQNTGKLWRPFWIFSNNGRSISGIVGDLCRNTHKDLLKTCAKFHLSSNFVYVVHRYGSILIGLQSNIKY